jgi:serine/threonine-protein kinase 24/25/MST4
MSSIQPSVHQLYKRLQAVGKGSYGSVHKGIEIATGNVVALKIINLDDDEVEGIQQEVALLSQLRDAPNITKYFGSFLDGPRLWIVMELAQGGSVYQLMKAWPDNSLDERYVVLLVREVLVGLAYLHKSGVIHRDIKSANVLVTAQGKVMICDFGVSALLATTASKRNTFIGTLNWMAPEVVQAVPNYDTKADIWSLGIMIYEMIKGSPPHSNVSQERVIQLIPRAKPPRLVPGEGSKDLLDFIPFCLTEKPGDVRHRLLFLRVHVYISRRSACRPKSSSRRNGSRPPPRFPSRRSRSSCSATRRGKRQARMHKTFPNRNPGRRTRPTSTCPACFRMRPPDPSRSSQARLRERAPRE